MTNLLQLSGIELGRRIREGDVSSAEVVERHIEQIERVNAGSSEIRSSRAFGAGARSRTSALRDTVMPLLDEYTRFVAG